VQEHAFRPYDANFFLIGFDALGERPQMATSVAAALGSHPFPGGPGKRIQRLRGDVSARINWQPS
jgi:hypothetical protein